MPNQAALKSWQSHGQHQTHALSEGHSEPSAPCKLSHMTLIQLAGEKGSAAQLARVLRPIMWRNSKRSSAGLGLELPPRTLTLTRLHFTPAEHTFYSHILEKTREARDALHHHEHRSNADSAGPSTASPNQSGKCATLLMVLHMHVIECIISQHEECCAVLCCAVLCCAVLCCAVLCCAVLCCAVLCCAVLCCAVLCQISHWISYFGLKLVHTLASMPS